MRWRRLCSQRTVSKTPLDDHRWVWMTAHGDPWHLEYKKLCQVVFVSLTSICCTSISGYPRIMQRNEEVYWVKEKSSNDIYHRITQLRSQAQGDYFGCLSVVWSHVNLKTASIDTVPTLRIFYHDITNLTYHHHQLSAVNEVVVTAMIKTDIIRHRVLKLKCLTQCMSIM